MKTVLYVDDDRDDLFLFESACRLGRVAFQLKLVPGGEQAIDYLSGRGAFANRVENPLPDSIVLDLKMPGKNGFEVLKWIRNHAETSKIPVILYSSSMMAEDISQAYLHGSTYFISKFPQLARLIEFVQVLDHCLHNHAGNYDPLAQMSVRA